MTDGAAGTGDGAPRRRRSMPLWLETVLLLAVALLVSALVKTFLVQMFFVPSGSMRPQLAEEDRILVEKVSYWGDKDVQRGDVVVFADPGDRWLGAAIAPPSPAQQVLARIGLYPTGGHLVKRVIGVGGDRVRCCDRRGRLRVNGVPLDERDYLAGNAEPSTRRFRVEVPEGRIWVMGDNRPDSEDSRFHQDLPGRGTVPESAVVGKVWGVVWPLDRFERLETPDTFRNPALQVTGAAR